MAEQDISIKVDSETYALIRRLAGLEDRSIKAIVRRAVKAYGQKRSGNG